MLTASACSTSLFNFIDIFSERLRYMNECFLEFLALTLRQSSYHSLFKGNGSGVSIAENANTFFSEEGTTDSSVSIITSTFNKTS